MTPIEELEAAAAKALEWVNKRIEALQEEIRIEEGWIHGEPNELSIEMYKSEIKTFQSLQKILAGEK